MSFQSRLPKRLLRQACALPPQRFGHPAKNRADEIRIDRTWSLRLDPSCGPMTLRAASELRRVLQTCFGVRLGRGPTSPCIDLRTAQDAPQTGSPESYRLSVRRDRVRIDTASDEAGLRALLHLGRRMLERQGPVLPIGVERHSPRWATRITTAAWHRPLDQPQDYLDLPDAYLMNLARYGYNALQIYLDWRDYFHADDAGELARAGAAGRIALLRQATEKLGQFGIRLMVHVNTMTLPADHAFFRRHPDARGAQMRAAGQHCLCSSSQQVLGMYERCARRLFSEVPLLAGATLLVGGECFLHCYTRPMPKPRRGTNCPRCARRAPHRVVANVINAFARGVQRSANPRARVLMWPYSAFAWGNTDTQCRLIKLLEPNVSLLSSFEKDDWTRIDGVASYVFDYSITHLGPSPLFRTLQCAADARGIKTLGRTETSVGVELRHVPRLPIMHRWAQRFALLRKARVDGVHASWRFQGFAAQRTDEIVDHFNWAPRPHGGRLLERIARRDFGPAAQRVVRAWKLFSDAFALYPYGGGPTGFPYFRGPFGLGAAHPFMFDLTVAPELSADFYAVDLSAGEVGSDAPHLHTEPRFFVDLTWTQPYGPAIVERRLKRMEQLWSRGVSIFQRRGPRLQDWQRRELLDELSVAQLIGCTIRTALHLVRFQMLRERLTAQPTTMTILERCCSDALSILRAELDNARAALALARDDDRLGYTAYGWEFTTDLIEQKIRHTEQQIAVVVPRFFSQFAFHMFGRFVDLTE